MNTIVIDTGVDLKVCSCRKRWVYQYFERFSWNNVQDALDESGERLEKAELTLETFNYNDVEGIDENNLNMQKYR